MIEQPSRTLVCSIVFLDIVDYSTKPVAEQLLLKQAFNKLLSSALDNVHARDRVVLDTGDGAAITFLGDPEDALFVAMSLRAAARAEATGAIAIRVGINLGPVRVVKDINGQMNIIGDGINVAQRVMSFSQSGQLLVSRSFYEVVSCLSLDYASLFSYVGARTDKHVREHEVYSVVGGTPAARRLAQSESHVQAREGGWIATAGPGGFRRSALIAAPLAFLLLVGGGVAARSMMEVDVDLPPTPKTATASRKAPQGAKAVPEKRLTEKPSATAAIGRLELAVQPWGEVVVDGRSRGVSPPLRVLEIPAGTHTIEIRNSTFPTHVAKIDVKAGEAVRIQHRFR